MIHIFGMSHAISVLEAFAGTALPVSHENFGQGSVSDPEFAEIEALPGCPAALGRIKAFVVPINHGMGGIAWFERNSLKMHPKFRLLLQQIISSGEKDFIFSFVHGNEHSILSMVQHEVPYDFVLPFRPRLPVRPEFQIVPYGAIQKQIRSAMIPTIAIMASMRQTCRNMKVVIVAPPPPTPSEAQILRMPEAFRGEFERFGVTPASIRLKYYLLYCAELTSALKTLEVSVLNAPPDTVDTDGFLREPYWLAATHGNVAYGSKVLEQMSRLTNGDAT